MLPPRIADSIAIVAHRGASAYAPENTMAAFELAAEMQADYIELDVHMSKDGELVVIHDEALARTTDGEGLVKDHTWEELRQLDAGGKFDPVYRGEPIPLLREVLARYAGRIGILIELKSPAQYPGLEEKLAELIEETVQGQPSDSSATPIMVQSFDLGSIQRLAKRLPDIPRAALIGTGDQPLLTDTQLSDIAAYADYINYNYEFLDWELVDRIHAYDRKVMAWTLRDSQDSERISRIGVDGIITDYPVWAYER
nr:glycerophosphodiester phosphodiesterase family protein [Paenibacillus phyllosphaerae]